MPYDYPPSQNILKNGPIDDDSHFVCDSILTITGVPINCHFEVAYNSNCRIVLILYLTRESFSELFENIIVGKDGITRVISTEVKIKQIEEIVGIDRVNGATISVQECFFQSIGNSRDSAVFSANRLIARFKSNSINSQENKPARFEFDLAGVDFYPSNFPFLLLKEIFPTLPAFEFAKIPLNQLKYPNQPTASLNFPSNSIPEMWTAEQVSTFWCALTSIAFGKDIEWLSYTEINEIVVTKTWTRRNRPQGNNSFQGLISYYSSPMEIGLTQDFVCQCMQIMAAKTESLQFWNELAQLLRNYVRYRVSNTRSVDESRLICSTVDEFLSLWEAANNINLRKVSLQIEPKTLLSVVNALVIPKINEQKIDDAAKKRIRDRVRDYFKKVIYEANFLDRLVNFFTVTSEGLESSEAASQNLQSRLNRFVSTRNHTIHTGQFPTEDPKVQLWYHTNAQMMLPLMLVALFQWKGKYIDLIEYWADSFTEPPSSDSVTE